ncbi:MAG: hypothetical protein FIA95_12875, partial [Gemmatimonadetes bacterium]|nr:hypothetical protein [Gemmatimonadota bacterium]
MYDEFERAMTGRSSSGGMSVLGWLAAGFGFFFLVGLGGIGFAIHRAVNQVDHLVQEFDGGARLAALALLADLQAQKELISMDPDRGLDFLRGLEGVRTPAHTVPLLLWTVVVWVVPAFAAWTMLQAMTLSLPFPPSIPSLHRAWIASWEVLAFVGVS